MRAPGRFGWAVALALLAGCQLDRNVLYHCDLDSGTPCQPGATCLDDGLCHWDPVSSGCTPASARTACQAVACGWADAGCGTRVDCLAWCPAGLECGVAEPNACGVPHLCTPQGWCWENPLPSGMGYQAMLALSPRQLWLGGEQGVAFFDGEKTRLEALPLTGLATVHGLAASSASDVYAVGTGGLVAHYDGTAWHLEDAGTSATLRAVQATAGGAALAAGDQGVIRLRSPATGAWSAPGTGTFAGQDFVALATLPSGQAVLGSSQGLLVARTGADSFALLETSPLMGVRALATVGGRLYAAGPGPGLWLSRRDPDGGWTALLEAPGAGLALEALAVDGEDLWLVGQGVLQRWAGGADAGPNLAPGTLDQAHLLAGAPVRPGELLAGGENGALAVAWADGGVALRSAGPTGAVSALCGGAGGLLAATGCQGGSCVPSALARASTAAGFRWSEVPVPALGPARALTACLLEDPARGWLTTDTSRVLRWDGSQLTADDLGGLAGAYTGAWGQPDAGYWLVRQPAGRKGELVATADFTPGSFTSVLRGSGARAVWGVAAARWVGAVGDNGFWSELDPSGTWSVTVPASTNALRSLHASPWGDGGVWWVAAGEDALWTRQGGGGPAVEHLPGAQLAAAWTTPTGTAFAAGGEAPGGGALLVRRDPGDGGWTPVPLLLGRPVTALAGLEGANGHTLWLGGDGGMLLRLQTR